jgi:hypothetical protein
VSALLYLLLKPYAKSDPKIPAVRLTFGKLNEVYCTPSTAVHALVDQEPLKLYKSIPFQSNKNTTFKHTNLCQYMHRQ